MKTRELRSFVVATLFSGSVATSFVACGGSAPPPKFATPAFGSGTGAPAAAVATNASGQQVGISDASSSGDVEDRPKMNASARAAYDRAMSAWQQGDLAGARSAFLEATSADPNAFQAFYSLGVVQERMGDSQALSSYRQSFTLQDTYEPAIVAYGLLLAKRGSLQEADDFLSSKHDKMGKSAAVLAALAEVKSLKHDTGSAQQLAQEALKINPDYRPAMVTLARDHYRNRRLDLALYALQAILDGQDANNPPRDKNNAEAHLLRAIIFKEQNKRAAAIDEFKAAVALRPDLVDAKVQLAAYLLESGNADEAAPLLESALKYKSDNVTAHLNLGDAYRIQGKTEQAKKELDWVTSKDPSVPQAYYSLGLLYLFASSVPGMDPKAQVDASIAAFEKFQQLRGKAQQGASDDSDQLLLRAHAKKDSMEAAEKQAQQPPPPPPAGSDSAAPPANP